MPLQATSGAASYDAFGGGVPVVPAYIEEVFSCFLYAGNDDTQVITNGIDLSTKGGLVWCKSRTLSTSANHVLFDSARGVNKLLFTNTTGAQQTSTGTSGPLSFNTTGFTLQQNWAGENRSSSNQVSWTFRKQPKFFDVVTYTGNGTAGRTVAHSLGSVPACIIVKAYSVDTGDFWGVYHRSLGATKAIFLSATNAAATSSIYWNNTEPTSTNFTVGDWSGVNQNGTSYVAYIYAHDAGGFGLTGTDNVISCGSFVASASVDTTVSVGFEPQWLLIKSTTNADNWRLVDNLRGMPLTPSDTALLFPNTSDAETSVAGNLVFPTSTGFVWRGTSAIGVVGTHIYIAIRRGPMKVPTTGTSVFGLSARSGTGANATVTGGQTDDAVLVKNRGSAVASLFSSRLTGTGYLVTSSTAAEVAAGVTILQANPWDVMDGVKVGTTSTITNASGSTFVNYLFKRAPSFMDVVCYTGTGVAKTETHNLQAVPQLIIVRERLFGNSWMVQPLSDPTNRLVLNTTAAQIGAGSADWNSTAPTSSVFSVGSGGAGINQSGGSYVAYLFATCAGVSKVGSYTGTATTKQIDCGFTAGARFVLIKRTDSTGDWYVWDTARGIIAGNDPYLLLNSTAAEVTSTDYIDTYSAGFELSSTAPAAINASGGTYIFLAIA